MERESMLAVCRLAYMLIDELVENEEQREKNLKTVDKEYNIKFSYGIAGFPDNGVSLQELLKAADINMYKNKDFNKKN